MAQAAISCLPHFHNKEKQCKYFHAFKFYITFCRYANFYSKFSHCFLQFEKNSDLDSAFSEILSFAASRNFSGPERLGQKSTEIKISNSCLVSEQTSSLKSPFLYQGNILMLPANLSNVKIHKLLSILHSETPD